MIRQEFSINLIKLHWLENYDDPDDRCAHGKVRVLIGNEIVADNTEDINDWWALSAMALHLLRTLETNHTEKTPIAQCLIPGEGHHIDHKEDDFTVHIETAYPMVNGCNWWVTHSKNKVTLETKSGFSIPIPFETYKQEVITFVDKIEDFYKKSSPKNLPIDKYDRDGYLKFWKEWHFRRNKWN
jgi:hypothetical protein